MNREFQPTHVHKGTRNQVQFVAKSNIYSLEGNPDVVIYAHPWGSFGVRLTEDFNQQFEALA